ncbi:hypothetical protein GBA52_024509 [Prunus armeniaca]|nr:hypothetical protein GBA52_024509 [Prunus armeniaca]
MTFSESSFQAALDLIASRTRLSQPSFLQYKIEPSKNTIARAGTIITLKNTQESLGEYMLVLLLNALQVAGVRIHNETSSLYRVPIPPTTEIEG